MSTSVLPQTQCIDRMVFATAYSKYIVKSQFPLLVLNKSQAAHIAFCDSRFQSTRVNECTAKTYHSTPTCRHRLLS